MAVGADLAGIALFVDGLPVFVGLAGLERNGFITDRTIHLSSFFVTEDSV
jgi:hypothetical protein